jgi:hypothetical protein
MICKTFEVLDRGTFIGMLAIKLTPADERDRYLLARAGFGTSPESQGEYVLFLRLDEAPYDPYKHNTRARTIPFAHQHVIENFDNLENGSVICVEHLNGERPEPKQSEQETVPGVY